MNLPKYPIKADDEKFLYEFFSEGPKGSIKKKVIYSQIEETLFNLAFGDWNEQLNKKFPQAEIFTEGSTPARTRLYQMAIGDNLEEIGEDFEVQKGEVIHFLHYQPHLNARLH